MFPEQWTGFYMIGTSVMKELNLTLNFHHKNVSIGEDLKSRA